MKRKSIPKVVAVAAAVVILASVTALAVYLLQPADIAEALGYTQVAEAFRSPGAVAINETQTINGLEVTLMGLATGETLRVIDETMRGGATYAAAAVRRQDGTPMAPVSSDEFLNFYGSAFIKGIPPWQQLAAHGQSSFVRDGVLYILVDCEELEPFADRGVYLTISESFVFHRDESYRYDDATGEIARVEDYGGVNALFVLPLDPAKADPVKAAEILDKIGLDANGQPKGEVSTAVMAEHDPSGEPDRSQELVPNDGPLAVGQLTDEQRQAYIAHYNDIPLEDCTLLEDSVTICEVYDNDTCTFEYNGNGGSYSIDRESLSGGGVIRAGWSGGAVGDPVEITVFTMDADGVVRGMIYLAPGWNPA